MVRRNVLVIAPARSGSTLLGLGLGSHPCALYAGEIAMWDRKWGRFVDNDYTRAVFESHFGRNGFSPELVNPRMPWRPHPNITPQTPEVEAYLRDLLTRPNQKAIVGKITFDTMPIGHALWTALLALDLDILLLHRSNLLATLVSWKVAFETKVWNVGSGSVQRPEAVSVELDPLEVMHYFVTIDSNFQYWETIVNRRCGSVVEYSELTEDWANTMARIFRHLGWPPSEVQPRLEKRTQGSLQELVSNFHELKRFFSRTKWDAFFE